LRSPLTWLVWLMCVALTYPLGCADAPPERADAEASVTVTAAALTQEVIGDAVWDLEVRNAQGETLVAQRLSSARFGDGAGAATFVGPCDARAEANPNTVRLALIGIYDAPVGALGAHGEGAPAGALPARNPDLMTQGFTCAANEDVAVRFDVTVLRPAAQGFLDVAVSFGDVHCSAKYDCGADPLLFNAAGERDTTHILGFSCAAPAADGAPYLYLDPIVIDCGDAGAVTLDPAPERDGNQGAVAIGEDRGLFQWAVFRGQELGGATASTYWNVALGVDDLSGCTVATLGTADRGDVLDAFAIPASAFYPYVAWEVPLDGCEGNLPLDLGAVDGEVLARYTEGAEPLAFARHFPRRCGPGEHGCAVASCAELLLVAPEASDGVYWLDPDGPDGPEAPYEAYCDMTTDGGGWTLVTVHSDDGETTWTWDNRELFTVDRTTVGSVHEPHRDFKSLAVHDLPFVDLLAVHAPSREWAAYHGVGDGVGSLSDVILATPSPNCDPLSGYPMTAGTLLPLTGDLCNTDLYFNAGDYDGSPSLCADLTRSNNNATYGPAWSGTNNHACPFDDVGSFSSLGADYFSPGVEQPAVGFGHPLGLNTGAPGQAENAMQIFVRAPVTCAETADCPAGVCLDGACRAHVASCREWRDLDASESGLFLVDPLGTGAFEAYCDMTTDGGGWTLVSVHSDDGVTTWTWNNRHLFTTNRALVGSSDALNQDYKNRALHDLAFHDMLFVHAPSNHWASYHGVSDGKRSLAEHIASIPVPNCSTGSGHPMAAGTITATGTPLCNTHLYFNIGDYDGGSLSNCTDLSRSWNNAVVGPAWSVNNNNGCHFDDPGLFSGLGPDNNEKGVEYNSGLGFGWAMDGNTGAAGAGVNYLRVFVRD